MAKNLAALGMLLLSFFTVFQSNAAAYYNMGAFWRQPATIAPVKLGFAASSPSSVAVDVCSDVFTAQTLDGTDTVRSVTGSNLTVNLSREGSPSGSTTFYEGTDNTCTGSVITSRTITVGQSSTTFRLKHSAIESVTVRAADNTAALTAVTRAVGVVAGSSNTWLATGTGTGIPLSRSLHTAVWTGSEMIVWGGWNGTTYYNTGGKYTPSSDAWVATSTGTDVPVARTRHTAVWADSEMIVWGGFSGSARLNTGSKYTPGTDSWVSTSVGTNVPAIREKHTATWTGSVMVIWGGYSGSAALNTGGRFTPGASDSAGTWSTTNATGTPTVRYDHTATWTGTEVVIWGGFSGSASLNTGSRYNPSTDAWNVMATSLTLRTEHTAVWTGTEVIFWGGVSGATYYNTGARYNPTTNVWTALPTTGAPSARKGHKAVWTGTQMIVSGGTNATTTQAQGARYILTSQIEYCRICHSMAV